MRILHPFSATTSLLLLLTRLAGQDGRPALSIAHDTRIPAHCSDLKVRVEHGKVVRSEQTFLIDQSSTPVQIRNPRGGVLVRRSSGSAYGIVACKISSAEDTPSATRINNRISVYERNGQFSVSGPQEESWMVYFLVQAPTEAKLQLHVVDGEVGLQDVNGSIDARVTTGSISLNNCRGNIHAGVKQGPLAISGSGGEVAGEVETGPLAVSLEGSRWADGVLRARAKTGPLTIRLPSAYSSSVRISMPLGSPETCSAVPCRNLDRDGKRQIQFGEAPFVVDVATGSGPVSIGSPR